MKNLFFRRATLVSKELSRDWQSRSHAVRPKGLTLTDNRDLGYAAIKGARRKNRFWKICTNLCSIKWWRYNPNLEGGNYDSMDTIILLHVFAFTRNACFDDVRTLRINKKLELWLR